MCVHREIKIDIDDSLAETIAGLLLEAGALAASIDDDETRALQRQPLTGRALIIAAFDPQPGLEARVLARLHTVFAHMESEPRVDISWADVKAQDWGQSWKQRWQVQHFGQRLVVCPSWLDYSAAHDELVLELDPGMAFGTGTHETTRLCAEAIERVGVTGQSLLDVGCGSGILALFALQLGARVVVATDKDPEAITVARDNAKVNGLADRLQLCRSERVDIDGQFDLVVANILKQPLVDLAAPICARLAPAGTLLLSGLLIAQLDEVSAAYSAQGWSVSQRFTDGEWGLLQLQHC